MTHPALVPASVAVITGGASGIGLAAALRFAAVGMRAVVVDWRADLLAPAEQALKAAGAAEVMTSAAASAAPIS